MSSRFTPLRLDDLSTPIAPRTCLSRRYTSPSPHRCSTSPVCDPCLPGCYSTSPCRRRQQTSSGCLGVPQRDVKSGRMVCDRFASVCYPRDLGACCSMVGGEPCPPRCRKPAPRCYKYCSPPVCPRGICPSPCRCSPPRPRSCFTQRSPCGDTVCTPEPSEKFMKAMDSTGRCSRYQSHLCPWEADVTVSGTIRAHCTSTADEISDRLSGPFKAFGQRYTEDSECNGATDDQCGQKLSMGMLDDGCTLDFSKNNRPTDNSGLDYRVRKIINRSINPHRTDSKKPATCWRENHNHISWDTSLDYNDDSSRFSKKISYNDRSSNRNRHTNNFRSSIYSPRESRTSRRLIKDGSSYDKRRNFQGDISEDERERSCSIDRDSKDRFTNRSENKHVDDYQSDSKRSSSRNRSPTFEIMMNRMKLSHNKWSNKKYDTPSRYLHNDGGSSKYQRNLEYDGRRNNIRRCRSTDYATEYDDEDDEKEARYSYRNRPKPSTRYYGNNTSRNNSPYQSRRLGEERRTQYDKCQLDSSSHYDTDFDFSKSSGAGVRDSSAPDMETRMGHKALKELERIRFWPCLNGNDND